jgi:hypothetical protein
MGWGNRIIPVVTEGNKASKLNAAAAADIFQLALVGVEWYIAAVFIGF